ncbi:hypothetical protein [Kribbella sp. ALI-6-A]|uniref:hypothetical protein n=1 Tax=Kribbella sp. ALI-6-A TaxID=1933817 RepID=UPI00143D10C2|nr:hypothetical protein [Kribbella sp. ALI-6-A]
MDKSRDNSSDLAAASMQPALSTTEEADFELFGSLEELTLSGGGMAADGFNGARLSC